MHSNMTASESNAIDGANEKRNGPKDPCVPPAAGANRQSGALRAFLRAELSGWRAGEVAFLALSCAAIAAISAWSGDTLLGAVSAVTGVAYTVCNGKGKRLAYVFGVVNSVLYAIIAFNARVYGDAALYALYYLPAMVVGFFLWGRHMSDATHEVIRRAMSPRGRLALAAACVLATAAGAVVLRALGDAVPVLDSFTTMISLIALVVALARYQEQWPLWTAVNAVEVALWCVRLAQGNVEEAVSSLAMWTLFLIIGVVMWVQWHRAMKGARSKERAR